MSLSDVKITQDEAWEIYWAAHPDKDPLTCYPFPTLTEVMEFAYLKKIDRWALDALNKWD